ncbi:MAG: HAMP domain-containing sensor histidine kinase [Bacteroidota bacterium]
MHNSVIRRVVLLGAMAIIGIIAVQSFWVMRSWDLKEEEFHQTANIALFKVAQQLAAYDSIPLPSYQLVNRKSSNHYVVNINNVIDAGVLEHYLIKEFEAHALNIVFEYAIYDCGSDNFQYGNICSVGGAEGTKIPSGNLPTYDEYTYYFVVKFPSRTGYIIGGMPLTIVFTIILFLAIIFFIYSLTVILKQKRLSEMQKDFINNMTHEFKTPISTIKISADVFLNHPDIQQDQRLHNYARIIKEQNTRLNHQVEKVLQLAKIERKGLELHLEKINLHELLKNILPSIQLKVKEVNGHLNSQLEAQQPIVKADKIHLTNILYNLLDNAIKYCRQIPEINVYTQSQGQKVTLQVIDRGIGIDKAHQSKVFDKFYRVPTGNIHNVKGFGLGLYYIHNICQAHGWKIRLDSQPNNGTTISIEMDREPSS